MVQFLPNEALASLLGLFQAVGFDAVAVADQVDVGVGGHMAQGVRHRPRMLDVQVAPPEDGLDPLESLIEPQRYRWEPALVLPLRLIGNPQDGHVVLFAATSGNRRLFATIFAMRTAEMSILRHTICPISRKVAPFEF